MKTYATPTVRPSAVRVIQVRNVGHDPAHLALPTLAAVRQAVAIPDDTVCAYLSGSVLAGWGHRFSDLDVFVVTRTQAAVDALFTIAHEVALRLVRVNGLRWDVEYWRADVIDELIARFEGDPGAYDERDADTLYRLDRGKAVLGDSWLTTRQARLRASGFGRTLARRAVNKADNLLEDALGMADSGDCESAVIATRLAFGKVTDAVLHQHGDWCASEKWRARRLAATRPAALSLEEWWRIETMQDLDPSNPEPWVRSVIARCRELILEVDVA